MEKIKNMINPGKSKDDEVMYGTGESNDSVHTGTGTQATRSHNASEPLSSSTATSTREPVGQGATGSIQQGSTPLSSSHIPGAFDDDAGSALSIKSGQPGNSQESKITGIPETHDPLDTNKALPREPTTGGAEAFSSSNPPAIGPHSSGLANKVDPRVDSDLDGSRGFGGHDIAGTAGGLTRSTLQDRTAGNTSHTTDSGRSFPLGGASSRTTTSGPHGSDLANKADPRVDSDRDGSRGLGGKSGYGAGTGATPGTAHQGDLSRSGLRGTSGVPLPRDYGEESWTHDHGKHGHDYAGDPCKNESSTPGAPHFTSGPHSLDTANRLDPHVGVATGGLEHATTGSTTYPDQGHTGASAATSGAGLGYESSRDTPGTYTTQQATTTAGPHKSDLLNRIDPRVDSDLSKQQGASTAPGFTSTRGTSSTEPTTSREHHPRRDAALTEAEVGLGETAAYEAGKHSTHNVPKGTTSSGYSNPYPPTSTSTGISSDPTSSTAGPSSGIGLGSSTSTTDPSSTTKDHRYGRDAGLAGAGVGVGAGAGYDANKHVSGSHGDPSTTQQPLSGSSRTDYGQDTGVTRTGQTAHHDPRHQPVSGYDEPTHTGESYTGRNAALGAGGEELSRKDLEREQKAAHKEELKEQKAAHKEDLKEQKAAHKQELKEEKHHQHELDKAEKKHEKALAKEEAKHHHKDEPRKEEAHEGEKKHHGLFGFLHRDKPDKGLKEEEAARKEGLEHQGASGVTGTTAGMSEMEKHQLAKEHDRNRLHKDPPPGYGETKHAEEPKSGYASQVTGDTGTTALAQGDPVARGSHATGLGNKVDPK
ncbi:MAG: hypothetical protein Q9166_007335 [cf. Caloplaca sp. 2 TL-2023]